MKKRFLQFAVAALAVAGLTLASQPANAANELYTWTDDSFQSISVMNGTDASGSQLRASGTLTRNANATNGDASFSGTVTYTCGPDTRTGTMTMGIAAANLGSTPTRATVNPPADASCAAFTTTVGVAPSDGTTTLEDSTATTADDASCEGSLAWLTCPVINNVSGTISKIATGVLTQLLEVNRITPDTVPQLYDIWQSMRDLSEVFFILIFVAIIFATLLQHDFGMFDQYTIKRTLPRLVIAAILVQFSFLICGLLVDFGNVLGGGVETLIRVTTDPNNGPATLSNVVSNMVVDVAALLGVGGLVLSSVGWAAALPLILVMLASLLVLFLTLGARFLIIALLIVASPLAVMAWVLPNTEHWFKKWFDLFFKLILMYPIIVAVLVIAGVLNAVLSFNGSAAGGGTPANGIGGLAAALIKPLIVIGAFLIIPAAFKFAGAGLNRIQSTLSGFAGRGTGLLRKSDWWQRGVGERDKNRATQLGNLRNSSMVKNLSSKGALGRGSAGLLTAGAAIALGGNSMITAEGYQRKANQLARTDKKSLEELKETGNPENMHNALTMIAGRTAEERAEAGMKLQQSAPIMYRYGKTAPGRSAIAQVLADKGFINKSDIDQFVDSDPTKNIFSRGFNVRNEVPGLIADIGAARKTMPGVAIRNATDKQDVEVKNAAGNVIHRIGEAKAGDIDVPELVKQKRKITSAEFAKFSNEENNILLDYTKAGATPRQKLNAEFSAFSDAQGLDPRIVAKAFSVSSSNHDPMSLEAKFNRIKAWQATREIFVDTAKGATASSRSVYAAAIEHLEQDDSLTLELSSAAGMSSMAAAGLSNGARAMAVKDWYLHNQSYNAGKDYEKEYQDELQRRYDEQREKGEVSGTKRGRWSDTYERKQYTDLQERHIEGKTVGEQAKQRRTEWNQEYERRKNNP